MMCCSPSQAHHASGQCHGHHGSVGTRHDCGCHGHSLRRVYTRQEELTKLEGYLEDLRAEVKAVEERISGLKEQK